MFRNTNRLFYFAVVVVVLAVATSQAEAAPYISIIRSNTCEKTDCISIKDLIRYDNSSHVSGRFVEKDGDYVRTEAMKNSLEWYKQFKTGLVVFVDPDRYTLARSKQITLVGSLEDYVPFGAQKKVTLNSTTDRMTVYNGAYIEDCSRAIVGVKQYPDLDVIIRHMAGSCKTDIKNKVDVYMPKTKLNFCGQECQHQKFMKAAKSKSKVLLLPFAHDKK